MTTLGYQGQCHLYKESFRVGGGYLSRKALKLVNLTFWPLPFSHLNFFIIEKKILQSVWCILYSYIHCEKEPHYYIKASGDRKMYEI